MNYIDKSPKQVEQELREDPENIQSVKADSATGKIMLELSHVNGQFTLNWKVGSPEKFDWVGLYKDDSADINDYKAYKWVSEGPPYNTVLSIAPGYQARYYRYNQGRKSYDRQVETELFPLYEVSSECNYNETKKPTDPEWVALTNLFPNLKTRDQVIITADQIRKYNCIAWSLGIDDRWIEPPITWDAFKWLYLKAGCRLLIGKDSDAAIDMWMLNGVGKHGSKRYAGDYKRWESKLGPFYRITHGREDVHGDLYGEIAASFTAPTKMAANNLAQSTLFYFDQTELTALKRAQSRLSTQLKKQFERLFLFWKAQWFTGKYQFSSNTKDHRTADGYQELLALGRDCLPLLVEKLLEEENFPALVLYDDLQSDSCLKCMYTLDTPFGELCEGEQTRAKRTAKAFTKSLL